MENARTDSRTVLTREGRDRVVAELEHLRNVRRKEVAERLQAARESEDPRESTEFQEAKNEQAFVEGRILALERLLAEAVVLNEAQEAARKAHGLVELGTHVRVEDDEGEEEYYIVSSAEADPRRGRISISSPVGRALAGHKVGETVEAMTPAGIRRLTIVAVA